MRRLSATQDIYRIIREEPFLMSFPYQTMPPTLLIMASELGLGTTGHIVRVALLWILGKVQPAKFSSTTK